MSLTLTSKSAAEAALSRVSKRKYADTPLSREEITHIVELAGKAPSAFNVQPWRFIAVTDPDVKEKLQGAAYGQPQVGGAPVVFVLTSDVDDSIARVDELISPSFDPEGREKTKATILGSFSSMSESERRAWARGQSYIALGYLLLLLESLGYASSPMLGFVPDAVRELLGLPATVEIPALIAVGYAAEEGRPQYRLPVDEILQFI